jgi:tetratricopeptide (TPR) repeat protein
MKAENYTNASAIFEMAANLNPESAEVYFSLAQCYEKLGNKEKAIENIKKSILIYQNRKDQESLEKSVAVLQLLTNQNNK